MNYESKEEIRKAKNGTYFVEVPENIVKKDDCVSPFCRSFYKVTGLGKSYKKYGMMVQRAYLDTNNELQHGWIHGNPDCDYTTLKRITPLQESTHAEHVDFMDWNDGRPEYYNKM